jgi:protein-tyrosine phosphatase
MSSTQFVDIHCHMLPGIDDGATDWDESLAMAKMACEDGITSVVVTPHQLGAFGHNSGDLIRGLTEDFRQLLRRHGISLDVRPGADVRIEDDMMNLLRGGSVLSLGDHRKHVLLELPHELYFPLEPVLDKLTTLGMQGILSHPERNLGLLRQRNHIPRLVQHGCLMQVTGGSLLGAFGDESRSFSEWMIRENLVHFIATDAHGLRSRRPRMALAASRVQKLADDETAIRVCTTNPRSVFEGHRVELATTHKKPTGIGAWFRRKSA